MAIDVFVSVGRPGTPEQEQFVAAFETFLRQNQLNPRLVGRNEFSADQPLKFIQRVMGECTGTIVLALERIRVATGTELYGESRNQPIVDARIPTVWNQIEAAMAYTLRQPLLVIVEKGLRCEGRVVKLCRRGSCLSTVTTGTFYRWTHGRPRFRRRRSSKGSLLTG
jgi:hypothetical protein